MAIRLLFFGKSMTEGIRKVHGVEVGRCLNGRTRVGLDFYFSWAVRIRSGANHTLSPLLGSNRCMYHDC